LSFSLGILLQLLLWSSDSNRAMASRRKLRQEKRCPPEEALLEDVKLILKPFSFVLSVKIDFAGYFNTLGFTIQISENVNPYQLIAIENIILEFFNSYFSENDLPFSWQVGICCEEELVEVIDPHSRKRKVCPMCTHIFQDYLPEFCPHCYSKI